jgi:hypothetical protein
MSGFDDGGTAPPPPPPPPSAGGGGAIPERGLGDILSTAFEVYKANAVKLMTIVAGIVIPLSLLNALIANVIFKPESEDITNPLTGTTTTVDLARSAGTTAVVLLIGAVISVIIVALLQAALMRGAALGALGEPVDPGTSYRYGFRRSGSVIWISILVGLIVGVGALVIVLIGVAIKPLLFLFIIAAIVWAVFSATQLGVAVPSLVVEDLRGTDALQRSWNLVRSHFWHVLGTVVVAGLITGLIGGLIGALGSFGGWFGRWVFQAIAQIITSPFTTLVTILLYIDLRVRKEALTGDELRTQVDIR